MNRKREIHVPPEGNVRKMLVLAALGVVGIIWLFLKVGGLVPILCMAILVACFIPHVKHARHFTLTEQYLIVRYFGIPCRKIPWDMVSGCTYLGWMSDRGFDHRYKASVILTLRPVNPFVATEYRKLLAFLRNNRSYAYEIRIPKGNEKEYLKTLEGFLRCPVIPVGIGR